MSNAATPHPPTDRNGKAWSGSARKPSATPTHSSCRPSPPLRYGEQRSAVSLPPRRRTPRTARRSGVRDPSRPRRWTSWHGRAVQPTDPVFIRTIRARRRSGTHPHGHQAKTRGVEGNPRALDAVQWLLCSVRAADPARRRRVCGPVRLG